MGARGSLTVEIRRGAHDPDRAPLVSFGLVKLPSVPTAMICLPVHLSVHVSILLPVHLSILLAVNLSIILPILLPVGLAICLPILLPIGLAIFLTDI